MRVAEVIVRYYSQGVFNRPLSSEWFCFKEALCCGLRFSFPLPTDFHHTVFDLYCSSLLSMRIQRCSTAFQRPLQCWFYPVLVYYGLSRFSSCYASIICSRMSMKIECCADCHGYFCVHWIPDSLDRKIYHHSSTMQGLRSRFKKSLTYRIEHLEEILEHFISHHLASLKLSIRIYLLTRFNHSS